MGLDKFLKALGDDRCECYRMVIIQAADGVLFHDWDNCGGLWAGWGSYSGQGLVEYLGEDPRQLVRRPSAPVAPEAVGSHSFPWVQWPQRAPHLVLLHNVGWWAGVV